MFRSYRRSTSPRRFAPSPQRWPPAQLPRRLHHLLPQRHWRSCNRRTSSSSSRRPCSPASPPLTAAPTRLFAGLPNFSSSRLAAASRRTALTASSPVWPPSLRRLRRRAAAGRRLIILLAPHLPAPVLEGGPCSGLCNSQINSVKSGKNTVRNPPTF